jgi:hypothetical protein
MPVRDLLNAASGASAPSDPYFYDVSLLLNGDGTNGAQNNTFLDSSSNAFTITRNGNTTQGSFSPYGNLWSNYFSGSATAITNGTAALLGTTTSTFTVECWVCLPTQPNNGAGLNDAPSLIAMDGVPTGSLDFAFGPTHAQKIALYWWNSGGVLCTGSTTLQLGVWYHIAASVSSNSIKLFVNGVQETLSGTTTLTNRTATTNSFFIGSNAASDYVNYYNAFVSNVRVVSGTALYSSNFTPSTTNLTAVSGTVLLACQSNRFKDNSTNNYTFSTNNSPSVQRFSPFNPTAPYSTATIGGSGYFDGSTAYLNTASSSAFGFGSGAWTLEAWVYPTTSQSDNWILMTNDSGKLRMRVLSGNLSFYTDTGSIGLNSTTVVTVNAWSHVAITYDGTTLRLYQNGIMTASTTASISNGSSNSCYVGQNSVGGSYWNGYICDSRIVKGTAVYTGSTYTIPTSPETAISGTSLLINFTNAGIPDLAMQNDLQTVGSAQVSTSVKKYGTGSLSFDGSTSYLTLPSNPIYNFGSGNFTIECWVYLNSYSNSPSIFDSESNSNYGVDLAVTSGGKAQFNYSVNGTSFPAITGATTLSTSTWYHLAVVRNGSALNLYVNGTSDVSTTISGSVYFTGYNILGARSNLPVSVSNYLNGYIDDFRITAGYARYTTTFTPPTSALPTY